MARFDYRDIVLELIELFREQKLSILQQLTYYRASVYKTETAKLIEKKVEQMQLVSELLGDSVLLDAFHDYDAMRENAGQLAAPGECPLTSRLNQLFQSTDQALDAIVATIPQRLAVDQPSFDSIIKRHRRDLLAMCRQGSRQWAFFQALS